MPKRRIHPGIRQRRSRSARQHLRVVRELQPDERQVIEHAMLTTHDLEPGVDPYTPVFGDTWIAGADYPCASCPRLIRDGDEVTMIDGEPNCADCTEEARRG